MSGPAPGAAGGRLAGRVAIVTGSTRGIGQAVAHAFAREGAAIVVSGTREETVADCVAAIAAEGGRATGCAVDLGTRAAGDALVDAALAAFGRLDILVNNAMLSSTRPLLELREEDFDREVRVNLRGTVMTTQAAVARVMAPQRSGKIINMTSHAALRGAPNKTGYASTKAAIAGLTISWATEFVGLRINVNAVAPAAWTDSLEALPEARREKLRDTLARGSVLQRLPRADDLAGVMTFLASADSDYLTGQIIEANGQAMHLL